MTDALPRLRKRISGVLAGAVAVAVCARLSLPVPGSPVPQSLQTLAVVAVGGALGGRWGVAALMTYVFMGAVGLPVFADGASGVAHLRGATGGYLAGFVVGAGVAGWWAERAVAEGWGRFRRGVVLAAGFVLSHVVILGMGWARLALLVGPMDGWTEGVAPFLWGGVVKSVVAAAGVAGVERVDAIPPAAGAEGPRGPVEPGPPAV